MAEEVGLLAFSLNKRKSLEAAQKYFQKGQYDRALKEYLKHLESEPDDANARLKLAELYRKLKDPGAAIQAYNQVAQQFSRSGFDAKAAAIYRQILKVDEACLDARIKLGEHCQRMGLASEALRELQEAIRLCQERGLKREAFDLLKRVADLDPSNVPNRLSLADLLAREGLSDEAQEEFGKLLTQAEQEGALDVVARVAQQMAACFPDSERAMQALGRALVSAGQHQDAITRILQALPRFPGSVPIREVLIAAYQGRGDEASVQTTYREIAEIYRQRGNVDHARDILQRFVPVEGLASLEVDSSPSIVLGAAPGVQGIGELTDEASFEPQQSRRLSDEEPKLRDDDRRVEELLAEARVARDFGDVEEARRCAERVLATEPHSAVAREILTWAREESAPPLQPVHGSGVGELDEDDLQLVLDETAAKLGVKAAPAAAPALENEDVHTLPDIELVLVDDSASSEGGHAFASVEVPAAVHEQRARQEKAKAEARASGARSNEEFEIDLDDLDLADDALASAAHAQDGRDEVLPPDDDLAALPAPVSAPVPAPAVAASASSRPAEPKAASSGTKPSGGVTWSAQSSWVGKTIDAADAILEQGLHDQAEVLYRQVLTHVPNHPQALLRLGELEARRGKDPAGAGGEFDLSSLEDTSVDSAARPVAVAAALPAPAPVAPAAEFMEFSQIGLAPIGDEPDTATEAPVLRSASVSAPRVIALEPVPAAPPVAPAVAEPAPVALPPAPVVVPAAPAAAALQIPTAPPAPAVEVAAAPALVPPAPAPIEAPPSAATAPSVSGAAAPPAAPAVAAPPVPAAAPVPAAPAIAEAPVAPVQPGPISVPAPAPVVEPQLTGAPEPEPAQAAAPAPVHSSPFGVGSLLDDEDLEGALEGIGIPAPREEGEDAFDLAAALDEAPGGKVEPAIQDVFRAFKKGIEAQIGAEEWGAHYDLAIAYREMGLVDDAVEQLEIVRRAGGLGIEGIALLATCKIELGAPEAAVELLREALKQETHPASLMALHYDLAEAYRSAGRAADALSEYRVVAEQEPQYREVQQRISELG